jgi:hypothetical protein
MKFEWTKKDAQYIAEIGNITLVASPDSMNYGKAKRGTKWRAQCSIWDEKTRTMSRYGEDIYCKLFNSYQEAKEAAEEIYNNSLT